MINSGDGGSTKKRNIVSRRMFILTAAKVIIFGGIITRLFSLQRVRSAKQAIFDVKWFVEPKEATHPSCGILNGSFAEKKVRKKTIATADLTIDFLQPNFLGLY